MNIAAVDFIDVSVMTAALVMKHSVHFRDDTRRQDAPGSAHHDTESIVLSGPVGEITPQNWFADVPHEPKPLLMEWPSAQRVLDQIASGHQKRVGHLPIFGKVMIVSLRAGGHVDWHIDTGEYADKHDRFHVCLIPSPGAWLYSGGDNAIIPQGTLAYFNNHVLHSAVNFGPVARVHLIVDVRKPESIQ